MVFMKVKKCLNIEARTIGLDEDEGEIVLRSISGSEYFNNSFEYTLNCLTTKDGLKNDSNLGKKISCTITSQDPTAVKKTKKIIGYITDIRELGSTRSSQFSKNYQYEIQIGSWLDLIDKTSDSRVFVNKPIDEIIENVLKKYSGLISKNLVSYKYMKKTCTPKVAVQYEESDANFISRVIEENGLFYYFEYSDNGPIMRICDDPTAIKTEDALMLKPGDNVNLTSNSSLTITPKTTTQSSYGLTYKDPINAADQVTIKKDLQTNLDIYLHHETNADEFEPDAQSKRLKILVECHQSKLSGNTKNLAFSPGSYFDNNTDDKQYAIIETHLFVRDPNFYKGAGGYICNINFTCIPRLMKFQTDYHKKKPILALQRAYVTGNRDKRTHSDENNMVQIAFHWDRYAKQNDSNGMWVPVLRLSAGKEQGFLMLPHVGDEVIVSFLGGNSYEPLVLGASFTEKNKAKVNKKDDPDIHILYTAGKHSLVFDDKEGKEKISLSSSRDIMIQSAETTTVLQKNLQVSADEKMIFTSGKTSVLMDGNGSLVLKCGDASIQMGSDGNIDIAGSTSAQGKGQN